MIRLSKETITIPSIIGSLILTYFITLSGVAVPNEWDIYEMIFDTMIETSSESVADMLLTFKNFIRILPILSLIASLEAQFKIIIGIIEWLESQF